MHSQPLNPWINSGRSGTSGQHASNISIKIQGPDHKSIMLSGSSNETLCLDDGVGKVLVFLANGGDGGQ